MRNGARTFYCQGCLHFFQREGHNKKIAGGTELCDPCSLGIWGKWKAMVYQLAVYRMSLDMPEIVKRGQSQ